MTFYMAGIPVSAETGSTMEVLETNNDKAKLFNEGGYELRNPLSLKVDGTFPKAYLDSTRDVKIIVKDSNGNEVFEATTTALLFNTSQQSGNVSQERFNALKEHLITHHYGIVNGGTGATTTDKALRNIIPDNNISSARAALNYSYAKTEDPNGDDITDLDQLDEIGVYELPTNWDSLANRVPDAMMPTKANEDSGVYCIVEPRGLHGLVQRIVFTKWSSLTATIPKFFMRYAFPADQSSTTREAWSDWFAWGLVLVNGLGTKLDDTQSSRFRLIRNSDVVALRITGEDAADLIRSLLGTGGETLLANRFHAGADDYQYLWRPGIDIGEDVAASAELLDPDGFHTQPYADTDPSARAGLVIL